MHSIPAASSVRIARCNREMPPGQLRQEVREWTRFAALVLDLVPAADRVVDDQGAGGADRLGREPKRLPRDDRKGTKARVVVMQGQRGEDPASQLARPDTVAGV